MWGLSTSLSFASPHDNFAQDDKAGLRVMTSTIAKQQVSPVDMTGWWTLR
jgi:hypothetical protein